MSRIIFPADNVGEAKAYITALTGAQNVKIPAPPAPAQLGEVLKMESKFISLSASAEVGFGYGSGSAAVDINGKRVQRHALTPAGQEHLPALLYPDVRGKRERTERDAHTQDHHEHHHSS